MQTKSLFRLATLTAVMIPFLSACVSQDTYDQAVADRDAARKAYADLKVLMAEQIAADEAKLTETINGVEIDIPSDVLFASGAATPSVSAESRDDLAAIATYLKNNTNFFVSVVGHTDSQAPSARLAQRYPTNWEMGAARAAVAARFLQNQGIDPVRIEASSRSQFKPVASNSTEEGRSQNRRIQIILRNLPEGF